MFVNVALGEQYRFTLRLFRDDAPPGVDDRRMAMGFPWPRVSAALCRSQQVALGLDGPGAHQHFPVRRARYRSEGGRRSDQFRTSGAQCAVQFGEAQVVAHAQPQPPHRRISHHHLGAVGVVVGLAVAATVVGNVHIEQVQLVIACRHLTVFVDQQRAGMRLGFGLADRWQWQGTGDNP
ncbi:hypothetical protein D3C76_385890 [compost metagenome]